MPAADPLKSSKAGLTADQELYVVRCKTLPESADSRSQSAPKRQISD